MQVDGLQTTTLELKQAKSEKSSVCVGYLGPWIMVTDSGGIHMELLVMLCRRQTASY